MKISIVMAYNNRKRLLLNTLFTISNSAYKGDLEVIIVDDASDSINELCGELDIFGALNIKVIRVDPSEKWWINPCIPYNIGFHHVTGDKIIIQNPECLHVGDILSVVAGQKDDEYIAFGAYSVGYDITSCINSLQHGYNFEKGVVSLISPTVDVKVELARGLEKWYQHSIYNPSAIHFCCSISKTGLRSLGGFDERFADGIAYDDREFLVRVKRMGLNVKFIDRPFVVHQCHGYSDYSNQKLVRKNELLLSDTVASSTVLAPNKIDYSKIGEVYI